MPSKSSSQLASSATVSRDSGKPTGEIRLILLVWLVLATILTLLAWQNRSCPGFYYDEAIAAGMAKDFVDGHRNGPHLPHADAVSLFGRPFPMFIQYYYGAVKAWLTIPSLMIFEADRFLFFFNR